MFYVSIDYVLKNVFLWFTKSKAMLYIKEYIVAMQVRICCIIYSRMLIYQGFRTSTNRSNKIINQLLKIEIMELMSSE